jgi:NAD(P)-dependent dehydrogenase (short-subunit alcohol dehydrogenase family)
MILKDKVIVITGVGPGMGCKLATLAAAEGARVVIAARSQSFIDGVAASIVAAGGVCIAVVADVSEEKSCAALADRAVAEFGRIDGLINSAYAPATFTSFEAATIDAWIANMDVTCFGALRMAKAVLPAMKKNGGAILNVTALAGAQPSPGQADYATAKSALEGATRQLAKEFGPYKIRVNAARMGWLWGAPVQGFLAYQAQTAGVPEADLIKPIADRIALGVIPPDEECANTALMFVSDYTSMVTGAVLDVNGGEYFAA